MRVVARVPTGAHQAESATRDEHAKHTGIGYAPSELQSVQNVSFEVL